MAPKKAAKKAAKKAKKHGGGGELRRAYEHLNRVGILHEQLEAAAKRQVDALSKRAQQSLYNSSYETAADLLRAAEHLGFGSLASTAREKPLNQELPDAALAHYNRLTERAGRHWEDHEESADAELTSLFHAVLEEAEAACEAGAIYRSLEYARAAEAIAGLKPAEKQPLKLPGKAGKKLRG
jgi:hypothetical protein